MPLSKMELLTSAHISVQKKLFFSYFVNVCSVIYCKYLFTVNICSFNILSLYTISVLLFGASLLFLQYSSNRSELFTIIGIAALFLVFPSARVANENPPIAKHNGRSMSKVLVYRIGFLDLTP